MKIVILGGTEAGVSTACALAGAGHAVTLVDGHSFAGGDIVSARHTWVRNGRAGSALDRPNGRTKMKLFSRLRDAGVKTFFMARCAGVFTDEDRACGLLIATKFGLKAVMADAVIDAAENHAGAYHLTGAFAEAAEAEYGYDLENAPVVPEEYIQMPETMGLTGHRVHLTGSMRADTVNVTFRFPVAADALPGRRKDIEQRAHELMTETVHQLRQNAFMQGARAFLVGSHTRMFYRNAPSDRRIGSVNAALPPEFSTEDVRICREEAARTALQYVAGLKMASQPVRLFSAGREITGWQIKPDREGVPGLYEADFDYEAQGLERMEADVVAVGMGAGGAMAGWALTESGADALFMDALHWCGGTNTVGMVYGAWHGYQDGAYKRRAEECKAAPGCEAYSGRIGAMLMWERLLGARMRGGVTVCGAVCEGRKIKAALVCDETGLKLAYGRYFVDGTADGDLCVFAGAEYTVGGPRDGMVQTSSMWGSEVNRFERFNLSRYKTDQDVVSPDSYQDLLRGIALGYQSNSEYDMVEMYMQRESRRFACRKGLRMAEIARRGWHEDDIAVSRCIHDTHGRPSSMLNTLNLYSGNMMEGDETDIRVRIPLGALLPEAFDNVALAGKSMGGEREAVALCRMNPEICNAGYAVGACMAQAAAQGAETVDEIHLGPVQQLLRAKGVLPEWAWQPADTLSVEDAVRALDDEEDGGFSAMVQEKEEILPHLMEALGQGGVRALNAAMALAWHGEACAAKTLTEQLKRETEKDAVRLERRGADVYAIRQDGLEKLVNEHPTYGYVDVPMNDPDCSYSRVNRLIGLIGLAGGDGLDEILEIAARCEPGVLFRGRTPYSWGRIDTHRRIADDRVWCIAQAAERLADRRAVGTLERLMDGMGQTENGVMTAPRCVQLEIALARAAAHCGSRKGALKLAEYLSCERKVFAGMAEKALCEVFGGQETRAQQAWRDFIDQMKEIPVTAYRGNPYEG